MDLKSSDYLQAPPPFFHSHVAVGARKENPFVDGFADSLCELNLKEPTGSANMAKKDGALTKRNVVEAPSTPGRPIFSFSVGSRKNIPSKWDNAEKWVVNGHESPAHGSVNSADFKSKHCGSNGFVIKHRETEVFFDESQVIEERVTKAFNGASGSADVFLKDRFTNEVEPSFPKFKCLEPMNDGYLFSSNSMNKAGIEAVQEAKHKDTGTEMTPIGSSSTSRCHTPLKSLSPPRHNTPASRSGPLALMDEGSSFDIGELREWHLAKLQLHPGTPFDSVTSYWSSREEEEEDISKSLRHFAITNECLKSISGPRPSAWEEQEQTTTKSCLRYKIEEAKIQAWVNLQRAKAEAQSRKLEVKIEKMRSKCEEKSMKKMAVVDRKAEELRAAARVEHTEQVAKAKKQAGVRGSCGCFMIRDP